MRVVTAAAAFHVVSFVIAPSSVGSASIRASLSLILESLEMDDEGVGRVFDRRAFERFDFAATRVTHPLVLALETITLTRKA